MVWNRRPGKLLQDMIGPLFVGLKIRLEIIGEEKQLKNSKHDKKLDQNDLPQGLAHGHGLESVPIKGIYAGEWPGHVYPPLSCEIMR
jgi:hypothetical protein